MLGKLEATLAQPIRSSALKFFPDGFAGDIDSPQPFSGTIRLSWFGRIGATVVGSREATVLEATLFLRGAGKRLVAFDGEAYLWLTYGESEPGKFGWSRPTWLMDEYSEHEHWR